MQTWQILIFCGFSLTVGFCVGVGFARSLYERRGLSAEGQKQNVYGDIE